MFSRKKKIRPRVRGHAIILENLYLKLLDVVVKQFDGNFCKNEVYLFGNHIRKYSILEQFIVNPSIRTFNLKVIVPNHLGLREYYLSRPLFFLVWLRDQWLHLICFYTLADIIRQRLKLGFFHCYCSVLFVVVLDYHWVGHVCCVVISLIAYFGIYLHHILMINLLPTTCPMEQRLTKESWNGLLYKSQKK